MKYQIELTEAQLRVVKIALEEYFRVALAQWDMTADRLAMKGVDFSAENPNRDRNFDRYIARRDAVRKIFEAAGRILWDYEIPPKDDHQLIAEDIWSAIRHQLYLDSGIVAEWRVDAHPPYQFGPEPLPTIKKVEETT